jgi:hypothetical protein
MVADLAQASEPAAAIAPNVASARTNFRIESIRCLRGEDDNGPEARQKEAQICSAPINACVNFPPGRGHFVTFPGWHFLRKLVLSFQLSHRISGGMFIRRLALVLLLCGAAALIGTLGTARAFETQDSGDPVESKSLLAQPHSLMMQDFKGHSLAMPLSDKADSSGFVSSYGNSIVIPAPGLDQPTPAWASTPGAISLH